MQDPGMAFLSNLVENFARTKALQFQNRMRLRQEDRYERQLKQQTAYQKGVLGIREKEAEARKAYYDRYRPTTVSIFSPSQVGTLGRTAEGLIEGIAPTETGGFFGIGTTKYTRKSDILAEYKRYKTGIAYDTLTPTEQQQADFAFDNQVRQAGSADAVDWEPDTDFDIRSLRPYTDEGVFSSGSLLPYEPSPFMFKGGTSSDTTQFPAEEPVFQTEAPALGIEAPVFLQGMREAQPENPFAPRLESPAKKPSRKYKIGEVITKGGKRWKVVGFDTDGSPLVEERK